MGPLLLLTLLSFENSAHDPAYQGRLRPPDSVPCGRDQLTSYTGTASRYQRTAEILTMLIRTDENTRERVEIRLKRGERWEGFFLWNGSEFRAEHWPRLETAAGKLKPGMRVTAWVCSGGVRPVLDWQTPPE